MSELLKINVNDHTELLQKAFGSEWRQHPAHPAYWFSMDGGAARIKKRANNLYATLLKGCKCGQRGYTAISYPIGGGRYGRIYVHRAVCELFVGKQPALNQVVRHLDCNNSNNRASNLAWGTASENAMDGLRNGRIRKGFDSPNALVSLMDADRMKAMRRNGLSFREIGEKFGISRMTATRAINNKEPS